ncbi:Rof/RNase P-like [Plasmopara halstedii]|uniref:Rof/RNase P-like n=1 Tax=Plasmopara halstedii TaxID=4781 RepID=A0A0N7L7G9_PLAHL|nr:Rof/RNase P-like [Plasmopara halstedii]CEG47043.1 Rof/RNase P-like [Plasmopara halstedii]|eukprot:XP_024583412.1 Rof/RNase P-like [Plasmopara halstedii]
MPLAENKKRPRADLLSSLDAVFSASAHSEASKYTALAAVQTTLNENDLQAYQHIKRKRKGKKREKGSTGCEGAKAMNNHAESEKDKSNKVIADPLYETIDVGLLAVGLKNCSLRPQVKTLTNSRVSHETLKRYLESVTVGTKAGSDAINNLKNKVLSLDNPFKTTTAETKEKALVVASKKQTAKLLSARRRRMLNLHMLGRKMKYSHAEQLNLIWTRYVSQVIACNLDQVEQISEEAQRIRNAKLQTKLKYMDLSGCRIEGECSTLCEVPRFDFSSLCDVVIQSCNPCNIGLSGIVVAETMETVQICRPVSPSSNNNDGYICTLVKFQSRFRVIISQARSLHLDGAWFAERRHCI